MKKILFLFLFVFSISWGQTKTELRVNWLPKTDYNIGPYTIKIPQFEAQHLAFDSGTNTLLYTSSFPTSNAIDDKSLIVSNLITSPISTADLGQLDKTKIPVNINATLENSVARDKQNAVLTFSPIIQQNGGYYKVISFTYSYAFSNLRQANTPNDFNTLYNSVLASGDFYRFYITPFL